MKFFFTVIIILKTFFCFSQVQTKTQKVLKILEPQSFYLNGGTKSMLGGNSRTGFKIDLPPNTVEWYYAFTTEPNKNNDQIIQLDSQIEFIIQQTTGISGNLLNLIKIPIGQGLIDIFLTDRKGYDIFFKKDFFGTWEYTTPNHNIEGSRTNIKDGKIKIDDVTKGSHFIVIRNTSSTTGINVKLEVVAIVEETITDLNVWDKKSKDLIYSSLKSDMEKSFPQYNEDKIEEVTGCVMSKFTTNLKPVDLSNMAEYELKAMVKKYVSECNL